MGLFQQEHHALQFLCDWQVKAKENVSKMIQLLFVIIFVAINYLIFVYM